ncbi:hypothetical protein IB289_23995 [Vibrio parahaemolyticus]|uniref:hypothetical protein n=1 Tax=Vibrio parahaemolyticus TaxID=670 RepID=UPI001D16B998|nr:hypothetical protein [Vibrio parahaemolyticus]MCC3859411.1 hypothetical protein [Vibrio parahaemolyticus]
MVKPAKPKKAITQGEADAFANMADLDSPEVKPKRGNPRVKKNKTASFSIPIDLDEEIDNTIELLAREGMFGVSRSDIVVAALTSKCMAEPENIIKEVKRVKGI